MGTGAIAVCARNVRRRRARRRQVLRVLSDSTYNAACPIISPEMVEQGHRGGVRRAILQSTTQVGCRPSDTTRHDTNLALPARDSTPGPTSGPSSDGKRTTERGTNGSYLPSHWWFDGRADAGAGWSPRRPHLLATFEFEFTSSQSGYAAPVAGLTNPELRRRIASPSHFRSIYFSASDGTARRPRGERGECQVR